MLLNRFRTISAKYLVLLILGIAPLAASQDTKLPPDVKISEGSKLDKSQARFGTSQVRAPRANDEEFTSEF